MKKIIYKTLKFLKLFVIKPRDSKLITGIKEKFQHNERSFIYFGIKYLVDSIYSHSSPGVTETIITELIKHKGDKKINSEKILNIGGGNGQLSSLYKHIGYDVYNLDIDIKSPDRNNIIFDLNQNNDIPFPKESFDIIICQEIIEHIENPWKLIRDAKKLLKNNGLLIITTPNILSLQSKIIFLFRGYFKWFTPECLKYHINAIPYWEMNLIINKYDLVNISIKGSGDYYFNRDNTNIRKMLRNNESLIFVVKKK